MVFQSKKACVRTHILIFLDLVKNIAQLNLFSCFAIFKHAKSLTVPQTF